MSSWSWVQAATPADAAEAAESANTLLALARRVGRDDAEATIGQERSLGSRTWKSAGVRSECE